jgi:hypothetical protein
LWDTLRKAFRMVPQLPVSAPGFGSLADISKRLRR